MKFRKYNKEVLGTLHKLGYSAEDEEDHSVIAKIEDSIQEYFEEGIEPHQAAKNVLIDIGVKA